MAIAFSTSNTGTTNAASSCTVSITPAGSNSLVVACGFLADTGGKTISGMTYNGNSMTQIFQVSPSANRQMGLFAYLNGQADGNAHNVVATYSGTISNTSALLVQAYSGVSQTGLPDASAKSSAVQTADPSSLSLTTIANNCWLIGFTTADGGLPAASGGDVQRTQAVYSSNASGYDSNGSKSPPGSYSLAETNPGLSDFWMVMSVAPVGGATNLPILRVG